MLEMLLNKNPNYVIVKRLLNELKTSSSSDVRETDRLFASLKKAKALSQWLPNTLYPGDIFITSYPKSGNTWLHFLLTNLLQQQEEINFHTVYNYVPEIGKQEEIIGTLSVHEK